MRQAQGESGPLCISGSAAEGEAEKDGSTPLPVDSTASARRHLAALFSRRATAKTPYQRFLWWRVLPGGPKVCVSLPVHVEIYVIRLYSAFAPLGVPIGARPWRPDSFTPLRALTPAQRCRRRASAHWLFGLLPTPLRERASSAFPLLSEREVFLRGKKKTPLSSRAYIQQGPLGLANQNKISCFGPGSAEALPGMYACEGKVRCRAICVQQKAHSGCEEPLRA